jgi:hypothetical protein
VKNQASVYLVLSLGCASTSYSVFASYGDDLAKAVQPEVAKHLEDDMAGADAPGTHEVQALPGVQSCYFGRTKMTMSTGVEMNVGTLIRRAVDGDTLIEDNITFTAKQKPSRVVYRYTGSAGAYTMTQVGGSFTGKGSYVAGSGKWDSWTFDMDFGSGMTAGKGSQSDAALSVTSSILSGGKQTMTTEAQLPAIDAADCQARLSRVPPSPAL